MNPEITNIFGESLQYEVTSLLEKLGGMTDLIEHNFSQLKDVLEKNTNQVIKAITQEKNKEIADLKENIKAKDAEIERLVLKEGELKGKDELVASLNVRIN